MISENESARNSPQDLSPNGAPWDRAQRLQDGQECLQAALKYLARGWSVLALCPPDHDIGEWHTAHCNNPGKVPCHKWKHLQQRLPTEAEVRGWWQRVPTSNVGLVLGEVSGLVRVDVDGPGGEAKLGELSGGDLPPTLEFIRGDQSRGLLYATPPGVKLKTTPHKQDGKHQELRLQANGAQTVLPPSRHPSHECYQWEPGHAPGEIEAAPAPGWLLDALRPDRPKKPRKATAETPRAGVSDTDIALSALAGLNRSRAVDYDSWLQVGQCLHSTDPGLLGAWDDWSKSCPEKYQDGACAEKWASFRASGGLTLGTLILWATKDGWIDPRRKRHTKGPAPAAAEGNPGAADQDDGGGKQGTSEGQGWATGYDLILKHFKDFYEPVFRRGTTLYSGRQKQEVKAGEACFAPGKHLAEKLLTAVDAPKDANGPKRSAIPQFFRTWAGSAWKDLLDDLPEEEEAGEVSTSAEEQFRSDLSKAMKRTVTLAFVRDGEERRENRSLIDWCSLFAKVSTGWQSVRSYSLWTFLDGKEARLRIAVRVELFSTIGYPGLSSMTQSRFTRLCEHYQCGKGIKVRGGAARAVELDPALIEDLRAIPLLEADDGQTDGQTSRTRARERETSFCPSEGQNHEKHEENAQK